MRHTNGSDSGPSNCGSEQGHLVRGCAQHDVRLWSLEHGSSVVCADVIRKDPLKNGNVACRGTPSALKGCISDAECIQYLLTSRLGFQPQDITVLRDDNPAMMPTRQNMLQHMQMLTGSAQPGDSLFFHFSGAPACSAAPPHPPFLVMALMRVGSR